eukprot:TRINITY_DN6669_c0_g1_i8.p1 TRINITY_DN6669_c0_g1~~TRINITY_DN6669_c0_g1_i8.p1  ORF type:complete len:481 (+),score=75.69 TRINITY_DN6669_c0_g1_i8:61-1503(+)
MQIVDRPPDPDSYFSQLNDVQKHHIQRLTSTKLSRLIDSKNVEQYVTKIIQYFESYTKLRVVAANVKELLLDIVEGPDVIDVFLASLNKAMEKLLIISRHSWQMKLSPNSSQYLFARKRDIVKVTQIVLEYKQEDHTRKDNSPTQLMINVNGRDVVLGTLRPLTCPRLSVSLRLDPGNWVKVINRGNRDLHVLGYTHGVDPQKLSTLQSHSQKKFLFTSTYEEYASQIYEWITGNHFSTDQCSTPLKRSLIPICVEQLMELCSRGFIPISVQLGYVNPDSEKKKEFVVGYVPKEWITEIGKNLQKWCYVWATDEDGKLEANFYSPEDLQEEFFVHTEGKISRSNAYLASLLGLNLSTDWVTQGFFTPRCEKERNLRFNGTELWNDQLRQDMKNKVAFIQIAWKMYPRPSKIKSVTKNGSRTCIGATPVEEAGRQDEEDDMEEPNGEESGAKGRGRYAGELLDLLLNVMESCNFDKHLVFH